MLSLRLLVLVTASLMLLLPAITYAQTNKQMKILFDMYAKKFGKTYNGTYNAKFQAFKDTYNTLRENKMLQSTSDDGFTQSFNVLSDYTNDEYERLLGYRLPTNLPPRVQFASTQAKIPSSVDWSAKGYVTDVQNQADCGSCWAFAATGALEGQIRKKKKRLIKVSEQNLIDCSQSYGNSGCDGGSCDCAYDYITEHGIASDDVYPYMAMTGDCEYDGDEMVTKIRGYEMLEESEESLKQAVALIGPIAIAMDGRPQSFRNYRSGIYSNPDCEKYNPNHGCVVVGYGVENGRKYWLVKNNWSTDWGMDGYFKIARDEDNMCGIASFAMYPLI